MILSNYLINSFYILRCVIIQKYSRWKTKTYHPDCIITKIATRFCKTTLKLSPKPPKSRGPHSKLKNPKTKPYRRKVTKGQRRTIREIKKECSACTSLGPMTHFMTCITTFMMTCVMTSITYCIMTFIMICIITCIFIFLEFDPFLYLL